MSDEPKDKVQDEVDDLADDLDKATDKATKPDATADPETLLDARERDSDTSNDDA